MRKTIWWLVLIFGVALVAAIVYFVVPKLERPKVAPPPVVVAPPPATPAPETTPQPYVAPQTHFPVPPEAPAPEAKPLPALNNSDATAKEALGNLWSDKAIEERFHLKDFIRRVVATIDNLPRKKIAVRLMPVKPPVGKFLTTGSGASLAISPDNDLRYEPFVHLAEAIDAGKLVTLYLHLYPLFQQAYVELGYPNGYFNDRLIQVIDDLLAAPDLKGPVMLVQPKVFYQFADPDLEARSAGQKIMMRVGADNEARLKAKLREIRAAIVKQTAAK